jgi:hypothetical protein
VWLALSIANIWSSGVATAQHNWPALAVAAFFAVVCWGMSSVRVMAVFDSPREAGIRADQARVIAADLREEFPPSDVPDYIEREFGARHG